MAEADGKLTGRPGVCFVTRGPGATHGSIGVHTAYADSTPMIFLVGQVPRGHLGREALQELDLRAVFAPLAKWAEQDAEQPPRFPNSSAAPSRSRPRGGRVRSSSPCRRTCSRSGPRSPTPRRTFPGVSVLPAPRELAHVRERLARASRPLMIVGGGGWSAVTARRAQAFAEASALAVACSFRCQDYFDNSSSSYAGHLTTATDPALAQRLREADVLLVVGDPLGDVTTGGYALIEAPHPRQDLIHVHPEPRELGRVFAPAISLVSDSAAFFASVEPVDGAGWADATSRARAAHDVERSTAGAVAARPRAGGAPGRRAAAGEGIVAGDAGNFSGWVSRYAASAATAAS